MTLQPSTELRGLEESYVPHRLQRSLRWLKEARKPREAWPLFPGLSSDLHASAVVIRTLQLVGNDHLRVEIAESAAFLRETFAPKLSGATVQDLIDLLIAATAESSESAYQRSLLVELRTRLPILERGAGGCSTALLAQVLIVAADTPHKSDMQHWCDILIERQHRYKGYWPDAASIRDESVVATCWAVYALAVWDRAKYAESIRAGLDYLHSFITDSGWEWIEGQGTYVLSLTLRAFCFGEGLYASLQEEGIALLTSFMNVDGGWGVQRGEVSGTEYTALALGALVESGVGRFVPCRAAEKVILQITARAEALEAERDRLKQDFDDRVEQQCGRVLRERDKLRQEIEDVKTKVSQFEHRLRLERLESYRLRHRTEASLRESVAAVTEPVTVPTFVRQLMRGSLLPLLLGTLVAGTLLTSGYLLADDGSSLGSVFIGAALAALGIGAGGVVINFVNQYFERRRLLAKRVERLEDLGPTEVTSEDTPIGALAALFRYATEDLPPDLCEEIVYRLIRQGADMPPEYGRRFASDLLVQMHIPPRYSVRLEAWLDEWLQLKPSSRRAVLTQLRRHLL
ncbi:hypothetical protein [Micromonospora tulbaghiae]